MGTLQEQYKELVTEYAKEFAYITNISGHLSDDYDKYVTADLGSFNIEEIRYVVDNESKLNQKYGNLEKEIADWFNYVMACVDFGLHFVQLREWFMDKRKPTKDELAHIQAIRDRLNSEIERLKENYS